MYSMRAAENFWISSSLPTDVVDCAAAAPTLQDVIPSVAYGALSV